MTKTEQNRAILMSALGAFQNLTENNDTALRLVNHLGEQICRKYHSTYPNVKPEQMTHKQVRIIVGEVLVDTICK